MELNLLKSQSRLHRHYRSTNEESLWKDDGAKIWPAVIWIQPDYATERITDLEMVIELDALSTTAIHIAHGHWQGQRGQFAGTVQHLLYWRRIATMADANISAVLKILWRENDTMLRHISVKDTQDLPPKKLGHVICESPGLQSRTKDASACQRHSRVQSRRLLVRNQQDCNNDSHQFT